MEQKAMDETRYGKTPRWRSLVLGLPLAIVMIAIGVYWTLLAWGVLGDEQSETFSVIGPLVAGLGVALAYVVVRPRR